MCFLHPEITLRQMRLAAQQYIGTVNEGGAAAPSPFAAIVFQCVRFALPVVLCVVDQEATAGSHSGRDQLYTFLPPEIQVFL